MGSSPSEGPRAKYQLPPPSPPPPPPPPPPPLPRRDGLGLLRKMREEEMEAEAIILTANAELDTAIEAMKLGAFDYLVKPCRLHEMEVVIRKAFDRRQMAQENRALRRMEAQRAPAATLLAQSP